jgi:hypothetical protein
VAVIRFFPLVLATLSLGVYQLTITLDVLLMSVKSDAVLRGNTPALSILYVKKKIIN